MVIFRVNILKISSNREFNPDLLRDKRVCLPQYHRGLEVNMLINCLQGGIEPRSPT